MLETKEIIVPGMTNLVINDTPIPDIKAREIFAAFQPSAEVLSAKDLTLNLEANLQDLVSVNPSTENTIIIFPGYGADTLRSFLSPQTVATISPIPKYWTPATRVLSGNKPSSVNLDLPEQLLAKLSEEPVEQVWVCDDVIATGLTIRSLRQAILKEIENPDDEYNPSLRFSYPTQPKIQIAWQAFCWLQRNDAIVDPFTTKPSVVYKPSNGKRKVPLNSLSTLLSDTLGGISARTSYSKNNFSNPSDMGKLLISLKENL